MILEIQIRTKQMHQEAEFGIASHVFYKPPSVTDKTNRPSMFSSLVPGLFRPFAKREHQLEEKLEETAKTPHYKKIPLWISQIGQTYNSDSAKPTSEFLEDAQSDFFSKRIFVFTPSGDVVDLPVGATPVDFAYTIHSEVGDHTAGAKVNRKHVSLSTELSNGDIVEIETRKSSKPSPKWLDFTKTSIARKRIKTALEKESTQ